MKRLRRFIPSVLFCLLLSFSTSFATPLPVPFPSAKDKCPVCGMFVAKYPDWTTTVTFKDGSTLFFDGVKDFFTFFHNMNRYTPGRNQTTVASATLKDYYSLKNIDARKALFVLGSNVYGPMGKELVPFEKASDAQAFLRDHQGKKVLSFGEITPAILKSLE